tara:strand:+ start:3775 stop:4053 length:279 start_codon:yes stop_codon:yes gene_type:complete
LSYCAEDCFVGDLIYLKTGYEGLHGWVSAGPDVGIILEIIKLERNFAFYDKKLRCYDYVVCWAMTGIIEQIADILIERYDVYAKTINKIKKV